MKRLFLETNIVIDLLSRRLPFYEEAAVIFSLSDKKKIKLFISSLTIANMGYILTKQIGTKKAKEVLRKLRLIVQVLPLEDKIISLALNDDNFKDFEDGLQYYTAAENDIEIIITRNLKDFKYSKIPVMTAKQFIEQRKTK
ncbi:MAG: PIN domain-containing protein [Bacteroidales bacterium]|nr:PIN domain-containing protein [Bacteroidales bacterium]